MRELENRIQRATLIASGHELTPVDLGLEEGSETAAVELGADDAAEREELLRVLAEEHGIVAHAAERLGVSRQALYRKMARLGVELERRPRPDPG